jgi:hypothetical protein
MKLLLSLTIMLSVFSSSSFANSTANVVSLNKSETSFVKITWFGENSDFSSLNFTQCKGTPEAPSDCVSIGKRSLYTVAELRRRKKELNAEAFGVGALDVVGTVGVVAVGAYAGAIAVVTVVGEDATVGLIGSGVSTGFIYGTGIGTGLAATREEAKKLNPETERREAVALNDASSGQCVKSMNDFVKELTAALNF